MTSAIVVAGDAGGGAGEVGGLVIAGSGYAASGSAVGSGALERLGRPPTLPPGLLKGVRPASPLTWARLGATPILGRRHSGIGYNMPADLLHGRAERFREQRGQVLEAAEARAFEPVVAAVAELSPLVEVAVPGMLALDTRGPARYCRSETALARPRVGSSRWSWAEERRSSTRRGSRRTFSS